MRWLLLVLAGCDGVFGVHKVDPLIDAAPDAPDAAPDAQSTYKDLVLADHPVAYFPLDEIASSTTVTDLVAGLTGQVQGLAMGGADGAFPEANHAFAFNGVNGSIDLGNVFQFPGRAKFSVEAWVLNGRNDNFYYAIISKWRQPSSLQPSGWILYYSEGDDETPTFRFQRQDAGGFGFSANATPTVAGQMWHHVVGTYDGSQLTIYLDGVFVSFHASTESIEQLDTMPVEIGAQNGNSHDAAMLGSIDEVAIYDYVLSDVQISKHYAARSH